MIFPNLGGIPSNVHHSSSSTELLPWHNKSIQVCRVLIVGRAGLAAHQKRVDRAGHAVFAAGPASSGYGTAGWSRPVRWPAARNGRRRRRSADGFDAFLVVFGLETGPAADAQSGSGRGPDAADGPAAAAAASVRNGQRRGRRRPDAVLGRCLRHRAADAARWTRTAEKEVRQRSLAWQETGAITLGLTSFSHSFSVSLSFSLFLTHFVCVCIFLSPFALAVTFLEPFVLPSMPHFGPFFSIVPRANSFPSPFSWPSRPRVFRLPLLYDFRELCVYVSRFSVVDDQPSIQFSRLESWFSSLDSFFVQEKKSTMCDLDDGYR